MKYVILFISLFLTNLCNAQFVNFEWVKSNGDSINTIQNYDVSSDLNGNVYVTGYFVGTVDFDPGTSVHSLTSKGTSDAFIQKLDAQGNFVWVKTIGGKSIEKGYSVVCDLAGHVYVCGKFSEKVDIDPGTATKFTASHAYGRFIVKLDTNGSTNWAKSINTDARISSSNYTNLAVDASENLIVCGTFERKVDFNLNGTPQYLDAKHEQHVFILKLDKNGQFIWVKQITGSNNGNSIYSHDTHIRAVSTDSKSSIYMTGIIIGIMDFDPSSSTYILQNTGKADYNTYIAKLDSNGGFEWAKSFDGGKGSSRGTDIINDANDNVYISGSFIGTVDFYPGFPTRNISSNGFYYDAFLEKLDVNGNFIWQKHFGGSSTDGAASLDYDEMGNIYTTGFYYSTADLDPGAGRFLLSSKYRADAYIQKIDTTGKFIWAKRIGGLGESYGYSINTNKKGDIHLVGRYTLSCDFDPGPSTYNLTAKGSRDGYTLKLSQCDSSSATDIVHACDSLKWMDGKTYYSNSSSTYHLLVNSAGCDSIVALDLTIGRTNSGTDKVVACDTYWWIDGFPYLSSNSTATHILTNQEGCDSVVTLDLTLNYSNSSVDSIVNCDSITWIDGITYSSSNYTSKYTLSNSRGCDSVVTLNLTIDNKGESKFSACDSLTWFDGITYTSSNNTAKHIFKNRFGCDSTVTLNLTINNKGTDKLSACDSYKWIDGIRYHQNNNTATYTVTNSFGCDSLVTLDLNLLKSTSGIDHKTVCDSYTWIDGKTYTSNNSSALHTIKNSVGCDSLVKLNLSINRTKEETIDQITTSCKSYTWIDGNTYTVNNNSAKHIYSNMLGCDSTIALNLAFNTESNGVSFFPNPNQGKVNINLNYSNITSIKLYGVSGQLIYRNENLNTNQIEFEFKTAAGLYIMDIESECGNEQFKIVRN